MKRSLLLCSAVMMACLGTAQLNADDVQLTLDLNNATSGDATSGGSWELWARGVDNGGGADMTPGIGAITAYINGIVSTGITFNAATNPNGAANSQTLGTGEVEVVYGQDVGLATTASVGINSNVRRDTLIASGTWPAGATRPTFATGSDANFLSAGGGAAVAVDSVLPGVVVTLADLSGDGRVNSLDTGRYIAVLGGTLPYNPAADLNQDGNVNSLDTGRYIGHLGNTLLTANVAAVPEPASIALLLTVAGVALTRRSRLMSIQHRNKEI